MLTLVIMPRVCVSEDIFYINFPAVTFEAMGHFTLQ